LSEHVAANEPVSVLDEHRSFVLGIDDASRRGYSLLALGAMVVAALVLWATGTAVVSWQALWLAPVIFFVAVLVGRLTLLARHEASLRAKALRYCDELGLDVATLVREARTQGRYEYFVKLFSRARER
jgi:uncharacterized membrane protein YgcG